MLWLTRKSASVAGIPVILDASDQLAQTSIATLENLDISRREISNFSRTGHLTPRASRLYTRSLLPRYQFVIEIPLLLLLLLESSPRFPSFPPLFNLSNLLPTFQLASNPSPIFLLNRRSDKPFRFPLEYLGSSIDGQSGYERQDPLRRRLRRRV